MIIRVDGCHFSTYTKKHFAIFDPVFTDMMDKAALQVADEIGFEKLYVVSDEVSFYRTDKVNYWKEKKFSTTTAGCMSSAFTKQAVPWFTKMLPYFDAKILEEDNWEKYVKTRQRVAYNNAIQTKCHSIYHHDELSGRDLTLLESMIDISEIPDTELYGRLYTKQEVEVVVDKYKIPVEYRPEENTTTFRKEWVLENVG